MRDDFAPLSNGHGVGATPENVSRRHHDRSPHPDPLPKGEGDWERAARNFTVSLARLARVPQA